MAKRIRHPAVLFTGLLVFSFSHAAELSEVELRGKQIYLTGNTPSGAAISAILGVDQIELPASAAPCGSCHGIDGRGRPEGGVIPSDITWSELSKGYGHEHAFDRRHPAFDDASLAVSIIGGTDPAGNTLDMAMPRYRMERQDIDALVAYIKRIETDLDSGVTEDSITVGTLLPLSGPAASQGQAIQAVLAAFVGELNAGGGVNGRRVELEVIPLGSSPVETVKNVQGVMESSGLFALVASYVTHVESQLATVLTDAEIPIIGPITGTPTARTDRLKNAYYLYAGNSELIQSMRQFAASEGRSTVELPYLDTKFDAVKVAATISGSDDVFFLGTAAELQELVGALAQAQTWPRIFLPATAVTPELLNAPLEFDGRIFVAYPTQPSDVSANGRELFARLASNDELSTSHIASQISALAAARILVEAMRRAGHSLSRERLIAEIEGMNGYPTGLTPPISYGLNRRIGARGSHIVRLDLAGGRLVPATTWIELP